MKKSLRKDSVDDFAVDVGEAVVVALEAVGEFFVIEAEEVHSGGLEGLADDCQKSWQMNLIGLPRSSSLIGVVEMRSMKVVSACPV